MALEPCTRKVLAEKYGSPFARGFRGLTQAMGELAEHARRVAEAMSQTYRPRTCRLCGALPGHHDGCPLEVKA